MSNRFVATIALVAETAARNAFGAALIGGFALPFAGVTRATSDVDFLVEGKGSEGLDEALTSAGFERKHRNENVASYEAGSSKFVSADFLFARRSATLAMLRRAKPMTIPGLPRRGCTSTRSICG